MQRVIRALMLLETTDLPITEASRRCGFASSESLRFHLLERILTTPFRYR